MIILHFQLFTLLTRKNSTRAKAALDLINSSKQKENDARTQKRPEASSKLKKREEVSGIARHPTPTLQVSLLSQLDHGQFSDSRSIDTRPRSAGMIYCIQWNPDFLNLQLF